MIHSRPILAAAALLGAITCVVQATEWSIPEDAPLLTAWARDVAPTNALPDYPRPMLVRQRWQNLNGLWDYAFNGKAEEKAPAQFDGLILVPYPIESALSGVMKPLRPDQRLWYRRTFTLPPDWAGQRVLLHFGAVDWETTVWLNGRMLGSHRGGFDPFTFDITQSVKSEGTQELVVAVWDPTDTSWQLRGKQTLHPGGSAYTASSGIWQTVWLEPVPQTSVESLHLTPDLAAGVLKLTVNARTPVGTTRVKVTVTEGGQAVATAAGTLGDELTNGVRENLAWYKAKLIWVTTDMSVPIKDAKPWTPDSPTLYDVVVELTDSDGAVLDSVRSYAGMRSIALGKDGRGVPRPMLNGKPIMLPGALDQGYWPDGVYTAPTDAALRFDIEAAKRLGLVAIRKHLKVEPERFYYWADRMGLLILQDLPSGKDGDPFTDLPTSPEASTACEMERRLLIQSRWSHPSIIAWVMFNEGWGQHDTLRHARWAKQLDPTRLIDEASGFPRHGGGDIHDTHGGDAPSDGRRICLDSETAGFGLAAVGHSWPGTLWATGTYDPKTDGETAAKDLYPVDDASQRWYTRRMSDFYREMWKKRETTGTSGDFKVQLYDVETESNGLLSYDRAVWKVDPAVIRAAAAEQPSFRQAAAKGHRFNVRDFGAKADAESDDAGAFAQAIAAAIKAGPGATVFAPAGRYVLQTPAGDSMIAIVKAHGLTLAGEPGSLLISSEPKKHILSIDQSENVTVRRFEMDRNPLVFTQGKITAIDPAAKTVDVAIDKGYDEPDAKYLAPLKSFLVFTDPQADTWDHSRWWPTIVQRERLAPMTWRLTLSLSPLAAYAGKRFLIWDNMYKGWGVACKGSRDILVEDVSYYGGGADAGWQMWSCPGDVTLRRFRVGVPPGSDRLFACAGGSQEFQNRGTLTLEHCDFSRIDDDGVNMGTTYAKVLQQIDSRTIVVAGGGIPFQPGDTITLWDWFKKSVRQEARLEAFTREDGGAVRLTLDADVTVEHPAGSPGLPQRGKWDGRGRFEEFDGIDRIADEQAAGKLIVRHCRFQTMRARNILVKGAAAVIEDNTFYNTHMTAILAGPEFYWGEAPAVRNLVIRNNRFTNIDGASINLGCHHSEESRDNKNILIEGNVFEHYGARGGIGIVGKQGTAVLIRNADRVTVQNNSFGSPAATAPQDAKPLVIEASRHTTVKDNEGL